MRKPACLIGIDLGTTNWKAGIFAPNGQCRAFVQLSAPTRQDREGHFYHPDNIWKTFGRLTKQLLAQSRIPTSQLVALAVSSQGETGIPMDNRGQWLYPAITWFDDRSIPDRDWLEREIGTEAIFKTTGLTLRHIFTLPKLLWLKRRHPTRYRKIAKWLWLPDIINWRLTGKQVTEYSIASRSMLFDILKKRWDPDLCRIAQLTPSTFPTPVPAGHHVGSITPTASRATGLPIGLPIITGGHDHLCGAYAVGATEPGIMLDSIGTAESLLTTLQEPLKKSRQGYSVGCHVVENRYYLMGGLYSASAMVEWTLKEFGQGQTYDWMIREARRAPKGPTGILFLPHLWGSSSLQADPSSHAAIVRIRSHHQRPHLFKALFEGLCFEADAMRRDAEQLTSTRTRELIVIGGATRNPVWMDLKTTISGLPLRVTRRVDAVTLGAALLAGKGVGVFLNDQEVRRRVSLQWDHLRPQRPIHLSYQRIRPAFENLYRVLKQLDRLMVK